LHHWLESDDQRNPHSHPWWFFSFVLSGSYLDVGMKQTIVRKKFSIKFYPHSHVHKVNTRGCWTLLLTGPAIHNWGFYVGDQFVSKSRYFRKYGHHECE